MILVEQTTVPTSALPVQGFKDHLRLGTGFADDGAQDGLVAAYLRAAMTAVEARTGKVLLTRVFRWTLDCWRSDAAQALPVAPVTAILGVTLIDRDGNAEPVDDIRYRLLPDTHRPKLASVGVSLPAIPGSGTAEVVFEAGFGSEWSNVPPDLAQAVFLLGANFYERRSDGGAITQMPFGVMSLIERWRNVRVLGGGGAA